MTPGQINAELEKLDQIRSTQTRQMIDDGRGHERPTDMVGKTDPLSLAIFAVGDRRAALHSEIHMRAGPGNYKMPVGRMFGPRVRESARLPGEMPCVEQVAASIRNNINDTIREAGGDEATLEGYNAAGWPNEAAAVDAHASTARELWVECAGSEDGFDQAWPEIRVEAGAIDDQNDLIMSTDRSTHPTVVEYAVRELFKRKGPAAAAKTTAAKLSGTENMFFGPGVSVIDPAKLEAALWDRMANVAITAMPKYKAGKEHMAIEGTLQQFNQSMKLAARLRAVVDQKLDA